MENSTTAQTENFKEKIEFENSMKQRNFEIDLFWKRSWFFGALILAEIAGFYTLKSEANPLFPPVTLSFIICITTLAQCLMNRGSKYWQERWEYITMNREAALGIELTRLKKFNNPDLLEWFNKNFGDVDSNEWFFIDASIASKFDNALTTSRRFSVSKITFLVWDLIFICALLCWLNEAFSLLSTTPNWPFTIKVWLFHLILAGYIITFWLNGNVYEHFRLKIRKMKRANFQDIEKLNQMYVNNNIDSDFIKELK